MRKFMMVAAIAAMSPVIPASPATAGFLDGNKLYAQCTYDKNDPGYWQALSFCQGYITGQVDEFARRRMAEGYDQCLPQNVTIEQVTDMVVKQLREYPQHRSVSAADTTLMVIFRDFRCNLRKVN